MTPTPRPTARRHAPQHDADADNLALEVLFILGSAVLLYAALVLL